MHMKAIFKKHEIYIRRNVITPKRCIPSRSAHIFTPICGANTPYVLFGPIW